MRLSHISITASVPVIILTVIALFAYLLFGKPETQNYISNNISGNKARVALLNGCGRGGLAATIADALRKHGYDVVNGQGDNADSYDFQYSVVVDRKGNHREAEHIADDLGISTVILHHTTDPYIIEDFEIILGRDWDSLELAGKVYQE